MERNMYVTAAVGALLLAGYAIRASSGLATSRSSDIDNEVVMLAGELGIIPESLAVAGLSATDASTILSQLAGAASLLARLDVAKNEATVAVSSVGTLRGRLRLDPTNASLRSEYEIAVSELTAANASIVLIKNDLYLAALDGCPDHTVDEVSRCRANLTRRIPAEFIAINDASQDWDSLECAAIAERRATRIQDEELDPSAAACLADARARIEVAAAEQALLLNLDPIRAVFRPSS